MVRTSNEGRRRGARRIYLAASLFALFPLCGCHLVASYQALPAPDGGLDGPPDGSLDGLDGGLGDANPGPVIVRVEPTYADFADWNAYLEPAQPPVACAAADALGPATCIHGGEKRRLELAGLTSCEDLILKDALGLFEWTCDDRDGAGPVTFSTVGLSDGKGLRDLVLADRFRPNSVAIRRAAGTALLARSEPAVWGWTNEVKPLPTTAGNVASLPDPRVIYTVDSSRSESGYNVEADGIAVVTLDDAVLTWSGNSTPNCARGSGEISGADSRCQLAAGSQSFLWIEVALDAGSVSSPAEHGLLLGNVAMSRVHRSSVRNTAGESVFLLSGSHSNLVTGLTVAASADSGVRVRGSRNVFRDLWVEYVVAYNLVVSTEAKFNTFVNVTATHSQATFDEAVGLRGDDNRYYNLFVHKSDGYGIDLIGSRNVIVNAVLSNHRLGGFRTWSNGAPEDNIVVGVLTAHNGTNGGYLQVGRGTTVSHVTAANNRLNGLQIGISARSNSRNTVNQLLAVNNGDYGLEILGDSSSGDHLFSRVMAVHNHQKNIIINTGGAHRFVGDLWVSEQADNCEVISPNPAAAGLIDGSCTDDGTDGSNTYAGTLGATLRLPIDLTDAFVGKVTSDDTTNADDVAGAGSATSISDFVGFDNRWRLWGEDGPAFPHVDNAGHCLSQTCRIWDWRLLVSANALMPNINEAFVPNDTCPPSAHGDRALTDQQDPPHTFLVNAVEIVLDGVDNDNGLCESNEACLYSPSIGYYLGEGPIAPQPCRFENGRVSGVTLYGRLPSGG